MTASKRGPPLPDLDPSIIDALVVAAFRASGHEAPRAAVYTDSFNMRTKLAVTGRGRWRQR